MSHTAQSNGNRNDAMDLLLKAFDEWPDKGKPMPEGHICSYHWRKFRPNAEWSLMDSNNDVISKAEFHVAYFEAIRMEHHFKEDFVTFISKMLEHGGDYKVAFTRPQLRAMAHAIVEHDTAKDRLHSVTVAANRLRRVLTQ